MTTAFSLAYPPERSAAARVFKPLVDPRAYLRFVHLLLMMPLGIAYFTFFVTAFSVGGSLVWTFIGPPVLFVAMYVSLKLGDLEAWLVNSVARAEIRRPPSRLEGVTTFRDKVWARIIDPSTWTGLVYEFAQFPIGIGAFIAVVTGFTVSFYLMVTPLIIWIADEPVHFGASGPLLLRQRARGAAPRAPRLRLLAADGAHPDGVLCDSRRLGPPDARLPVAAHAEGLGRRSGAGARGQPAAIAAANRPPAPAGGRDAAYRDGSRGGA